MTAPAVLSRSAEFRTCIAVDHADSTVCWVTNISASTNAEVLDTMADTARGLTARTQNEFGATDEAAQKEDNCDIPHHRTPSLRAERRVHREMQLLIHAC